ncbi:hypothetical protein JHK87_039437 [Glycine soja]|nr:hypothetical protein JHK87_039437 [Glycine soja]
MAGVGSSSYKGNDNILFCFHCKSKTITFINGWQLRSGEQVQEIVLSADMQCEKCQKRVADIITKMNGK